MSFISPDYVVFFAVVVPLVFVIPQRRRWVLLLAASYLFYSYVNPWYLPLIIIVTGANYFAALVIDGSRRPEVRRGALAVAALISLGLLFIFKYFNFFSSSAAALTGASPVLLELVLPVGISFYTFQALAYTIDVYRGQIAPERHAGIMATFVAFFPQLVAGPIERAGNLLPQFRLERRFERGEAVEGLRIILWGLFKKVVIADRLALYVNGVYNQPEAYSGLPLIVATVFFAFQIYCDFSGYSDIAVGTARVLGFRLMDNFRQPYLARSPREFWARWHISLSTWFRDYVYIPLGGNRRGRNRTLLNLFIVFLVSGLWHGANWTFVIWGALHGLYVVTEAALAQRGWRLLRGDGWLAQSARLAGTFVLVTVAWVFFRANSISDAGYVLSQAFVLRGDDVFAPFEGGALLGVQVEFWLSWALIALLLLVERSSARAGSFTPRWSALSPVLRWSAYYATGAAVLFSGIYGSGAQQFIYFQF
jgi:D-alanyl-lipoteichoic acid acyltransferase DltB (MBOAT superfamily)